MFHELREENLSTTEKCMDCIGTLKPILTQLTLVEANHQERYSSMEIQQAILYQRILYETMLKHLKINLEMYIFVNSLFVDIKMVDVLVNELVYIQQHILFYPNIPYWISCQYHENNLIINNMQLTMRIIKKKCFLVLTDNHLNPNCAVNQNSNRLLSCNL